MRFSIARSAALAALLLGGSLAFAEDKEKEKAPGDPAASPAPRVLVVGDGVVRFHVERNAPAGRMTFRLADPSVKLDGAPVVVVPMDAVTKEFPLTAVAGQPGTWVWTDDVVKAPAAAGALRVVVAGRTYTSPLATVWTGKAVPAGRPVPRYGGRILALPDCGASVEVVQDTTTGTLTIYSYEDVIVTGAPVITVHESEGPTEVTLTKVDGKDGVWTTTHKTFKTTLTSARIRLLVNGKPCEAAVHYGATHGGHVVIVPGGPSLEVVHDPKAGHYTFYAVDETIDGKPYTIENPTVVYGGRTYQLTSVEGEPRAWRLVGFDAAGSDARDAQLNLTLFGKTLSTKIGLSGFGIGVK